MIQYCWSVYFEIQCYVLQDYDCRLCYLIWLNWNDTCLVYCTSMFVFGSNSEPYYWKPTYAARLMTSSLTFSSAQLVHITLCNAPIPSACLTTSGKAEVKMRPQNVILVHIWKWVHRNPAAFTVGIQHMPTYHVNYNICWSHTQRDPLCTGRYYWTQTSWPRWGGVCLRSDITAGSSKVVSLRNRDRQKERFPAGWILLQLFRDRDRDRDRGRVRERARERERER